MAYVLILSTLSLSSDEIPITSKNFHAFESQNPRTKAFGLDSIAYKASQLWRNVPKEIKNSISIKKVPLISSFCHCCKPYMHHVGLFKFS